MANDVFTIIDYPVCGSTLNEPIYLIPFGDIHRYSPACNSEKWLEFLDWAKGKKNCLFLGMGDFDDFMSGSERDNFSSFVNQAHDSTQRSLDDYMYDRTERFAKEIGFMKGKLIGMIEGNHYGVFCKGGMTTTQELCRMMGCKYLGCNSFIRLGFSNGSRKACVDIFAHHGLGAARLVGGSINSVEKMCDVAEADIYCAGHDHKKAVVLISRLRLNHSSRLRLSHRKILLARTGSFLNGYVDGESSYVAAKGLRPTDLGVVKIELTPRREKKGESDVFYMDIHCSI